MGTGPGRGLMNDYSDGLCKWTSGQWVKGEIATRLRPRGASSLATPDDIRDPHNLRSAQRKGVCGRTPATSTDFFGFCRK